MERIRKMINPIITLLPIVPIILLIVTIVLCVNANKKLSTYGECQGTIVELVKTRDRIRSANRSNDVISPVVVYQVNGRQYQFTGNYYSTSMKVGDSVKVMYDLSNHSKATLKTGLYVGPAITGGLALFFGIACTFLVILKAKGIL